MGLKVHCMVMLLYEQEPTTNPTSEEHPLTNDIPNPNPPFSIYNNITRLIDKVYENDHQK